MSSGGFGLVLAVAFSVGCRRLEKLPSSVPVPVATLTPGFSVSASDDQPAIESAWTPEPELTPTPILYGSTIEVPVRATPTPIDVGAIPNFDRPRDPTPRSRNEQLARCLSYQITIDPTFSSSHRVRLAVKARNVCGEWIPAEESGFEVISRPVFGGGTGAREIGQFQAAIPPNSSHAATVIEIECPAPAAGGCQYTASVWKGAGLDRKVE